MQSKILLKSFDNNKNQEKKIDLTEELSRLKAEQEIIFQKKIQDAEIQIQEKISKELKLEFDKELKKVKTEINQKYIEQYDMLVKNSTENYKIFYNNCVSIFNIFMNYYVKKLNKQIIHQNIIDDIEQLFKQNSQQEISLISNNATQQELQENIKTESFTINYITEDTFRDGDIQLKASEGSGIYFSEQDIIDTMNNIINKLIHNIPQEIMPLGDKNTDKEI